MKARSPFFRRFLHVVVSFDTTSIFVHLNETRSSAAKFLESRATAARHSAQNSRKPPTRADECATPALRGEQVRRTAVSFPGVYQITSQEHTSERSVEKRFER